VPDEDAAFLALTVHLHVQRGRDPRSPRRVVDAIHEVEAVEKGRPRTRLLHRWDRGADRFELVDLPRRFGSRSSLERRTGTFLRTLSGQFLYLLDWQRTSKREAVPSGSSSPVEVTVSWSLRRTTKGEGPTELLSGIIR
jgi:hypothetical protein